MRVKIGPYINWWGPFQIADLLRFVGFSKKRRRRIGTWERHICNNIGVRFTSIRKSPTDNFYVQDPATQITMSKPARHIELKKDIGQKILALGYMP